MLIAAAVLFATVVDPQTGLWFPPYASPQVYLSGSDPKHRYIADVEKAFRSDAQLEKTVCQSALAWKALGDVPADKPVRQKKTMLDIFCIARNWQANKDAEIADKQMSGRIETSRLLQEDRAKIARMSGDERRALIQTLQSDDAPSEPDTPPWRSAILLLALAPGDASSVEKALRLLPEAGWGERKTDAWKLLEQVYRRETEMDDARAAEWISGLRYLLLFTGAFEKARALNAEILSSNVRYDRRGDEAVGSFLEYVTGHPERFREQVASCPAPDDKMVDRLYGIEQADVHCKTRTMSLAAAVIDHVDDLGVRKQIATLYAELAQDPHLFVAVNAADELRLFDVGAAKKTFHRALNSPETPSGLWLRSLEGMRRVAQAEGDKRRMIALTDCWLAFHDAFFEVPEDGWARLRSSELAPASSDPDRDYIETNFRWRIEQAIALGDLPEAQRGVEGLLAYELNRGGSRDDLLWGILPLAARYAESGDLLAAARISEYVASFDPQEKLRAELQKVQARLRGRGATEEAGIPWSLRARTPSPQDPATCR